MKEFASHTMVKTHGVSEFLYILRWLVEKQVHLFTHYSTGKEKI
uniref:Uncharacterized protein n=1 Tax=Rhizophora mucronata TaxID=61149 RepID=A0A2P2QPM3_RHIMU